MQNGPSISAEMRAGGYTHIQIMCCHVVLKPLTSIPAAKLELAVAEIAGLFVCGTCNKRATAARVGLWKHGMKRAG